MICDPIGIKSWYRSIRTKFFCETWSLIISRSTKITICRSKNPTALNFSPVMEPKNPEQFLLQRKDLIDFFNCLQLESQWVKQLSTSK